MPLLSLQGGAFTTIKKPGRENSSKKFSRKSIIYYILSLIFLLFVTLIEIIGCLLLSLGQIRYNKSMTETLAYVMRQADGMVSQRRAISEHLATTKQMGVRQVSLPANVQTEIEQIGVKLSSSIAAITGKATNSSSDIRNFLNTVSLSTRVKTLECSLCAFISKNYLNLFLFFSRVILGWILVTGKSARGNQSATRVIISITFTILA
ncbi:unnamed protein product [Brassica rapa]|uniref:Uncharacterized protein n=1 Tax=Brassica campestris TaxID=3711 RepID=A0A3P6A8J6_BRACM|nr:unnamed protein product [Brassica rapa]VDC83774.1 unnamed protein product [Brassica rapa]